jgi:ribosomal protein L37AE/L43A
MDKERKIKCPYCGEEVTVFGSGYYGTWECPECEQGWFNVCGQAIKDPEEWDPDSEY